MASSINKTITLGIPANEPLAEAEKDMDQFMINFLRDDKAFQRNKKRNEERTRNIKNGKIKLFDVLISCSDKKHKNCDNNVIGLCRHRNMEMLSTRKEIINGTIWCITGTGWVNSDSVEQFKKEILDMKEVADIDLVFI